MNSSLFDLTSLLLVTCPIVAGLVIGQVNPKRGYAIAKDSCLAIGVVGFSIGFIKLLAKMDNPDSLA